MPESKEPFHPDAYRAFVEEMLVGVYLVQDGRLTYANRRLAELFGYSREQVLALPSVLGLIAPSHRDLVAAKLQQRISGEIQSLEYEVRGLRKDGEEIDLEVRSVRTVHDDRPAVLGSMVDVTERKRLERALRALAIRDDLTGLYNRRGFLTLAEAHLALARRNQRPVLLIFADLDNLKIINDRFGHAAGDRALAVAGQILRSTYRSADLVARIGGDEFTVFPLEAQHESADMLVDRLEQRLDGFNQTTSESFRLSMSVGVSRYDPGRPDTVQELLEAADTALYKSKGQRKPGVP